MFLKSSQSLLLLLSFAASCFSAEQDQDNPFLNGWNDETPMQQSGQHFNEVALLPLPEDGETIVPTTDDAQFAPPATTLHTQQQEAPQTFIVVNADQQSTDAVDDPLPYKKRKIAATKKQRIAPIAPPKFENTEGIIAVLAQQSILEYVLSYLDTQSKSRLSRTCKVMDYSVRKFTFSVDISKCVHLPLKAPVALINKIADYYTKYIIYDNITDETTENQRSSKSEQPKAKQIKFFNWGSGYIRDCMIKTIATRFPNLVSISLCGMHENVFSSLPMLSSIRLEGNFKDLSHLEKTQSLEELSLCKVCVGSQQEAQGVQKETLGSFFDGVPTNKLKTLEIKGGNFRNIKEILRFKEIQSLTLDDVPITSLVELSQLPKLQSLMLMALYDIKDSDEAIQLDHLQSLTIEGSWSHRVISQMSCPNLKRFSNKMSNQDRDDLSYLNNMSQLESLKTRAAFSQLQGILKELKSLRDLEIEDPSITVDMVKDDGFFYYIKSISPSTLRRIVINDCFILRF